MVEYIISSLQLVMVKRASDSGTCSGQVTVSVPHDQAHAAVDEGPLYDSTVLPSSNNGNNKASITTTTAPATKSATTMIPTPTPSQTGKTTMANSSSFSSTTNTVRGPSPQHQQQSPSQSPIQLQPQTKSPYPYPYQNQYPYQAQHQPIQQLQQGQQRTNQPPIANAGVSQTVYGGTIVTLDGRASHDPDNYALGTSSYGTSIIIKNGIAAYQWTQVQIPITSTTTIQSPVVMLQGSNTATPTFVAPVLPYDTMLAFSLKAMDSDGGSVSSNPAIVYVMIKHNPNNVGTTGGNTPGTIIIQPQQQQQPISPQQ